MTKNSGKKIKRASAGHFPFLWRIGVLCVILMSILVLSRQTTEAAPPEYSAGTYRMPCGDEDWEGPKSCTPQTCSRAIFDDFISGADCLALIELMETGLRQGDGGEGGAAIFDLASGAVSQGRQFINAFATMKHSSTQPRFNKGQLDILANVVSKVQALVEANFGSRQPVLTPPCFFSRINGSKPAITPHDEYWHPHVDKLQYEGFIYTALLYLNSYGVDFDGGEFAFLDGEKPTFVLPRPGRLVLFTSGSENTHRVFPVTKGIRRAATIAFSCNPNKEVKVFLKEAYALV